MSRLATLFTLMFLLLLGALLCVGAYYGYIWYQQQQVAGPPPMISNTTTTTQPIEPVGTIKIASWNLQRFGITKANKDALMSYYVSKLKAYDVIVLQEITDESGYATQKLCYMMEGYTCKTSERRGNTTYKEQYLILYDNKAQLIQTFDDPNLSGYQRPPFSAIFKSGDWKFKLTTIHTTPEAVHSELANLQMYLLDDFGGDKIVIGDLNADCTYYDNIVDFTMWDWVNDGDTTVGATDCAYDRIILNKAAQNNFVSFDTMTDVSAAQSDHYLIYGVFKNTEA